MDELFREAAETEARRKRVASAIAFLVAVVAALPVGWILASLAGLEASQRMVGTVAASAVLVLAILGTIRGVQWVAASTVAAIVSPGGAGRAQGGHSRAESLAAAGELAEASRAFESARAGHGDALTSLRVEAEIHAAAGGDPSRAADLLQRIRRAPNATPADELYATHRLIDLYLGALNDPGKVMTELRRMADRFPNTIDGQSALAELRRRREAAQSPSGDTA